MSEHKNKQGKIVVISGPSGVGKSTICKEVIKKLDNAVLSVSLTTRAPGNGEVDGQDYRFVSREDFQKRIDQGLMLEYAEVFGNLYGTPEDEVDREYKAGKTVILEIDIQGGKQARKIYQDSIMIFVLPPSQKDLADRMGTRGRDDDESAEIRLGMAGTEIAAAWQYYDNMVINDNLEQAVNEIVKIINRAQSK
jgi:guanylate kinase